MLMRVLTHMLLSQVHTAQAGQQAVRYQWKPRHHPPRNGPLLRPGCCCTNRFKNGNQL